MKIGILEAGQVPDVLCERHGTYGQQLARWLGEGFDYSFHDVEHGHFPASVHDADGWLVSGSRHGVYESHAFIPPLEAFLRQAYADHVPIVGICFGHQILAQALGGTVERSAKGWALGPHRYESPDGPIVLNVWHQDQVIAAPDAPDVFLSSAFCPLAGLRYGDRALSVQGHPEFDDDFMRAIMWLRGPGVVEDRLLREADARIGGGTDADRIRDMAAELFRGAAVTKSRGVPE